jgi:hypothetical protein
MEQLDQNDNFKGDFNEPKNVSCQHVVVSNYLNSLNNLGTQIGLRSARSHGPDDHKSCFNSNLAQMAKTNLDKSDTYVVNEYGAGISDSLEEIIPPSPVNIVTCVEDIPRAGISKIRVSDDEIELRNYKRRYHFRGPKKKTSRNMKNWSSEEDHEAEKRQNLPEEEGRNSRRKRGRNSLEIELDDGDPCPRSVSNQRL